MSFPDLASPVGMLTGVLLLLRVRMDTTGSHLLERCLAPVRVIEWFIPHPPALHGFDPVAAYFPQATEAPGGRYGSGCQRAGIMPIRLGPVFRSLPRGERSKKQIPYHFPVN
jgi:hypothetical protein